MIRAYFSTPCLLWCIMCSHVGKCNRKSVVKLVFLFYACLFSCLPVIQSLSVSDLYPFGRPTSDNKTDPADDVVNAVEVKTTSGWVRGYEENFDDGKVFRFVKIPFAKPPIGELRFRPPQPIGEWEKVQGISGAKSPSCPQWYFPFPGFNSSQTEEDCLYLNIYVPGKISTARNLSVMVWIHGGGFIFGAANQYKPQPMVLKGDVIVVTINYRLGLLGFFTMHDPLLSGNYGIMDQIEALRWIHNNIASFGGNPNSVTIFGESAGGMAVSLLTLIPSNEGLFQRAISQSGVVSTVAVAKKEWEIRTKDLFFRKNKLQRQRRCGRNSTLFTRTTR